MVYFILLLVSGYQIIYKLINDRMHSLMITLFSIPHGSVPFSDNFNLQTLFVFLFIVNNLKITTITVLWIYNYKSHVHVSFAMWVDISIWYISSDFERVIEFYTVLLQYEKKILLYYTKPLRDYLKHIIACCYIY